MRIIPAIMANWRLYRLFVPFSSFLRACRPRTGSHTGPMGDVFFFQGQSVSR
ncbi:hypothetical protein BACCAP_00630 [Pseudoflavonifractor capillosus ATCC 29799]|uniref:Uncharacterized protein n=1 Tax=Pseudoflavonifractor capillosus ATCC 29799 TaxID=411467 RepID=A6NR07_9FIRM|nr:hypothetical protein BACCAP_00630 [Pseudoflavonifractor capillosus ATCC 29799]